MPQEDPRRARPSDADEARITRDDGADDPGGLVRQIRAAHGSAPGEDGPGEADVAPVRRPSSRYVIGTEIARGGMGAIVEIRDADLRRSLAMKVLLGGTGRDRAPGGPVEPEHLNRFLEEAQVTAQLAHPGVIPVHELGMDDEGRVYFTMDLVHGKTLTDVFELARERKEGWTRPRALQTILRVCEAIAYAHDKGVIHRDLKPENVMIGRFGETYVMDWGLAKVLGRPDLHDDALPEDGAEAAMLSIVESERLVGAAHDSPMHTLDGAVLGTPAYMSPEQAGGLVRDLDRRSDVYAIGALIYELLAGHPPYVEAGKNPSPVAILLAVRKGPPPPLREAAATAPEEIVAICEKAMARERDARYATAADLAEDIQAFIDGRVVKAYRTGTLIELRKWVGRNRGTAAAMAAAVLALCLGLVVSIAFMTEARERQAEADRKAYTASLTAAGAEISDRNLPAAKRRLDELADSQRGWEWEHLRSRVEESLLELDARQFALLPDGRVVIPGPDGTVLELDLETGATKPHFTVVAGEEWQQSLTATATDGALLVREAGQQLFVIDATTGDTVHEQEVPTNLQVYITCSADGSACAWNLGESKTVLLDRRSGEAAVWGEAMGDPVAMSPDGRRILLRTGLRTVEARHVVTRELEYAIELNETPPNGGTRFSPDGSSLAISSGRSARVFDATTGDRADVHLATRHTDAIQALAFSPDGSVLASGSSDRTIQLVDVRTGDLIQLLAGHGGKVIQLAFSLDGRRLISRDDHDRLRVWDVGARREPDVLRGHASFVYPVAFSPDGARIYSGGWDGWKERPGCIRVWDAATGEPVAAWGTATQITESLAVSTDGARLFTCSRHSSDNFAAYTMQVWDALTGRELPAPKGRIRFVAVSPDGRFVGAAEASVLRLLDAKSLAPVAALEHPAQVGALAFSPDGRRVATVTFDGVLRVWSTATRELLFDLQESHGEAPGSSVTYSGDSRRIYVTSWSDHDIRIRDAETGERIASLEGHGASVFHVLAETAAGRTFSCGRDGRILVWDVEAHEQVTALSGHDSYVYALALSPNGRTLVSSSGDGTLRLWDTKPVRHRQQAIANRQRSVAELSPRVREMFDAAATDDDVFGTLRMDASLSERQREIALQLALETAVKRRQR